MKKLLVVVLAIFVLSIGIQAINAPVVTADEKVTECYYNYQIGSGYYGDAWAWCVTQWNCVLDLSYDGTHKRWECCGTDDVGC